MRCAVKKQKDENVNEDEQVFQGLILCDDSSDQFYLKPLKVSGKHLKRSRKKQAFNKRNKCLFLNE